MIGKAVDILRRGGLVAFPTETVYGLGGDATSADAVGRIFAAKGRPSTNPLIVHVGSVSSARACAIVWPDLAEQLAGAFWPGPLTLVLEKAPAIVPLTTAGRSSVGIRVPAHPLALELLEAVERPIAAPSANRSNCVSPTTAAHVADEMGDRVDLILDGGPCEVGIESTVLSLIGPVPQLLRPGIITAEQIESVLGLPVKISSPLPTADGTHSATSPGQSPVHYAPRTPAFRFELNQLSQIDTTDAAVLPIEGSPEEHARAFYAILRQLDKENFRAIYIEYPPPLPCWQAMRDRIQRATRPLPIK